MMLWPSEEENEKRNKNIDENGIGRSPRILINNFCYR
jgi:hypothetical protein